MQMTISGIDKIHSSPPPSQHGKCKRGGEATFNRFKSYPARLVFVSLPTHIFKRFVPLSRKRDRREIRNNVQNSPRPRRCGRFCYRNLRSERQLLHQRFWFHMLQQGPRKGDEVGDAVEGPPGLGRLDPENGRIVAGRQI
ncbi:hypothetical protein L596_012221 [Steinernema carpocapsae]|uniref:Uncharacterized protein n=1 Tax=Steinernema carpocapsae TaxID=34508 RepID=A0A4U5NWE0_STECR|nr:hypothetical protein L596_012221 [Steinernema carpocapsae]